MGLILSTFLLLLNTASAQWSPQFVGLEGVYKIEGVNGVVLNLTLIEDIESGTMDATISSFEFNSVFFWGSDLNVENQGNNQYVLTSNSVSFSGVRTRFRLEVDANLGTLIGELQGNFLQDGEPLKLIGIKQDDLFQIATRSRSNRCSDPKRFDGLFSGTFNGREAKLSLVRIPDQSGELKLSGNLRIGNIEPLLYHDGYIDHGQPYLILIHNRLFSMNGKARKLILVCSENGDSLILTGSHITSSGRVVTKIKFSKEK